MKPSRSRNGSLKADSGLGQHGVARVISKRGICSRSKAESLVRGGHVRVEGLVVTDPYARTRPDATISIDTAEAKSSQRIYLMLNKPRGLVTTAADEHGRATVYAAFEGAGFGWIAPLGRLDKASEGLLLFSNDSEWAARITAPESRLEKIYHVQIGCLPDATLFAQMQSGINEGGELIAAKSVCELRRGEKNAWLEIVLDEGRNRQIRRLLAACDIRVLRLIRVAIGSLKLGELEKGQWRELNADEVRALASPTS